MESGHLRRGQVYGPCGPPEEAGARYVRIVRPGGKRVLIADAATGGREREVDVGRLHEFPTRNGVPYRTGYALVETTDWLWDWPAGPSASTLRRLGHVDRPGCPLRRLRAAGAPARVGGCAHPRRHAGSRGLDRGASHDLPRRAVRPLPGATGAHPCTWLPATGASTARGGVAWSLRRAPGRPHPVPVGGRRTATARRGGCRGSACPVRQPERRWRARRSPRCVVRTGW